MSSRLKDLNPNEFKPIKKKGNSFDLSELDRVWPAVVEFENKKDEFEDFFSEFDTLDEFDEFEFERDMRKFERLFEKADLVDLSLPDFQFEEIDLELPDFFPEFGF